MHPRYRRMLAGLKAKKRPRGPREWAVYIVSCEDGSLYTGIAKDPEARFEAHRAGTGAAYTRSHRPVALVYREDGLTRSQALVREAQVKRLPSPRKRSLITTKKPKRAKP